MNIDREIAEKVRGWKYIWINNEYCYIWSDESKACAEKDWRPSTNIQHAMEVEAEMFRRKMVVVITTSQITKKWFVQFENYNYTLKGSAGADTLPEAICKAALEAVK